MYLETIKHTSQLLIWDLDRKHIQQLFRSFVNLWFEVKHPLLTVFSVLLCRGFIVATITHWVPGLAKDSGLCNVRSDVNKCSDNHPGASNILSDIS